VKYLGYCLNAAPPPRTREETATCTTSCSAPTPICSASADGELEESEEQRGRELWIVTELLERKSLFGVVGDAALQIGRRTQLTMMLEMCRGMVYLHDVQGVLHRDLKSLNIFVSRDWHVKIGDFEDVVLGNSSSVDSARQVGGGNGGDRQQQQQQQQEQQQHQQRWKAFDSLEWKAPEVLSRSAPFSHASDVFSAAVVLWEVFERQRPYEREFRQVSDIAGAVVGGFRLPLTAATPPAVAALIARCWAAEAAGRPSFAGMLAALQACMARCEEE
jgi:serine/threonine protein kinase